MTLPQLKCSQVFIDEEKIILFILLLGAYYTIEDQKIETGLITNQTSEGERGIIYYSYYLPVKI